MSLVRTPSGLANTYRFFSGVDYVVYCESEPDRPEATSRDLGFWSKVLSKFCPGTGFAFQRKGGKLEVQKIATALSGTTGHRSICLMDLDFDDILCRKSEDKFVIYTYGYSYENDLCQADIIAAAIDDSLPGPCAIGEILDIVTEYRSQLERSLLWPVVADQLLSMRGKSYFEREGAKYRRIFDDKRANSVPKVSRRRMIELMKASRANLNDNAPALGVDFNFWRRMFGHLCWWLHFKISSNIVSKHGLRGPFGEDNFSATVISHFYNKLSDDDWHISKHYKLAVVDAISAAA